MIARAPADPAGYAYAATTLWLQELAGNQELSIDRFAASDFFREMPRQLTNVDPKLESRFRALSEKAIDAARRRLGRSSDDKASLFLLGLAYQNLASFEAALKQNWWAAFRYGARAYDYQRELLRRDPQFYDAELAIGVCDYAAGSLGWSVRWLSLLMGYRGSRERGKQELEEVARMGQLAADDARVILVLIHTRERDYSGAYRYLQELHDKYPRNYLVPLNMAGLALRMKRAGQAIEIYRDILRRQNAGEPNYRELERASLYNRLGVASRVQDDFKGSEQWLRRSLGEPGSSQRAAALAHLELGKTLDAMGRRTEALAEYRLAAAAPDFAGSRQEAQQLLRRPHRK